MINSYPLPIPAPWKLVAVVGLALALRYIQAADQGSLLSLVQGNVAFDQNFIHELVHDSRHIAALPCH
jgi:hypothetical protein